MAYRKNVWNQIKGIDADRLIKALKKDSWTLDSMEGSIMVYIKKAEGKRVSVHYHSKKTFGRKLLTRITG